MSEEKILTLHPEGKQGVNISKAKYQQMKDYILSELKRGNSAFKALSHKANKDLKDKFDGSISWYLVSVKLDLEARGIIERIPKTSPHELRLVN